MALAQKGDHAGSVFWLTLASEQGDIIAAHNLANAYAFGRGCGRDLAKAAALFRRAAFGGYVDAMFRLSNEAFAGVLELAEQREWSQRAAQAARAAGDAARAARYEAHFAEWHSKRALAAEGSRRC